ncbi:MAG: hypothetical protein HZC47_06335 [Methanobacterium sp.]|uniref:hypothetical protein n=1 Tax=Methanobacterium sp. TaxID=2164 RepID=UPI003D649FBE|nr:hypothetical protein [Methanobacterium sp.]
MENCTLITTAHDESMVLKAIIESECSKCILLYQHTYEKIPETSFKDIEYIKIEGTPENILKSITNAINSFKGVNFYLANVHLDIYVLYYLLSKKEEYNIWILDNNQFMKMPQIKKI